MVIYRDQFLRSSTNARADAYGGSLANRARFLLEATDAAISVYGAARVGVHLSPRNIESSGAIDADPRETFGYVAEELGKRRIAFLFTREGIGGGERFTPEIKKTVWRRGNRKRSLYRGAGGSDTGRRRGGCGRLGEAVSCQPGSARTYPPERSVQRTRPGNILRAGCPGVYRLSFFAITRLLLGEIGSLNFQQTLAR